MTKQTIALIFGGKSSEYEVSCMSASFVINHISYEKYNLLCFGITQEGKWLLTDADAETILKNQWQEKGNNQAAFLSANTDDSTILVKEEDSWKEIHIDAIFPVLHGKNGEDGTIQGFMQLSGTPFVGCNTLASAICMDKVIANSLLDQMEIPQAAYTWFYYYEYEIEKERIHKEVEKLSYPVFVKPANAGSSVGVSKVNAEEDLPAAIEKAAKEDGKILVEEAIVGQEVECAVLGNNFPEVSVVGEVKASAEFYDYDDKYKNGTSETLIPAHISETASKIVRENAVKAYRFLSCSGLARVDFFVRKSDGAVLLNELNTLPGFTSISMYSELWKHEGLSGTDLIEKLLSLAFERKKNG